MFIDTQQYWSTSDGHEERGRERCYGLQLHGHLGVSSRDQRFGHRVSIQTPRKSSSSGQSKLIAYTNIVLPEDRNTPSN